MNRLASLVAAVSLLGAPLAAVAVPQTPSFTMSVKGTKVADGYTFQSDGGRQVAVSGNTVYVGFSAGSGEPTVARSSDGGLTWPTLAYLPNDPADPADTNSVRLALARDPLDATKQIVCAAWGTASGRILYTYFVDRPGYTAWSTPVAISGATPAWGYSLSIAAAPDGSVHVLYSDGNSQTVYTSAATAEAPFAEPVTVGWGDGYNHAMAFDASSNLYVVESNWDPVTYLGGVFFHKKAAGDSSWSTVAVALEDDLIYTGDNVSIAVADPSNIYVAYKQFAKSDGTGNHIHLAYSGDGGATWTRRPVTPNLGVYGTHPSIAVRTVNSTRIVTIAAHYVNYGPDGRIYVNRTTDDGVNWTPSAAVPGNQQASLALDANGKALVSALQADLDPADQPFVSSGAVDNWRRSIFFSREK